MQSNWRFWLSVNSHSDIKSVTLIFQIFLHFQIAGLSCNQYPNMLSQLLRQGTEVHPFFLTWWVGGGVGPLPATNQLPSAVTVNSLQTDSLPRCQQWLCLQSLSVARQVIIIISSLANWLTSWLLQCLNGWLVCNQLTATPSSMPAHYDSTT